MQHIIDYQRQHYHGIQQHCLRTRSNFHLILHVLFCTSRHFPSTCFKLESFFPVEVVDLGTGTLVMVTFSLALVGVPGTGTLETGSSLVLVVGLGTLVTVICLAWVVGHDRPDSFFQIDCDGTLGKLRTLCRTEARTCISFANTCHHRHRSS